MRKFWDLVCEAWLLCAINLMWPVRQLIQRSPLTYALMSVEGVQPFLVVVGKMRAHAVYLKAKRKCPAYRQFLLNEKYETAFRWRLDSVPVMMKDNYVKRFSIEERCYGGRIPRKGVVIDESSGSTGMPNNWIRSAAERKDVRDILQLSYRLTFGDEERILLNCFALGPWATGMNVSMSLVDVGIMKSIGPDRAKVENTLALFGKRYRYMIFGYPPFIRSLVDNTSLDLKEYRIDFLVGGEALSEGLRAHLLKYAGSVTSSYGASDLEINLAAESELTVQLRGLCLKDRELCRALFGREAPPMIFQYNAVDYVIETNEQGELLFTIGRLSGAAPKIRYNLRDAGGTYSFAGLRAKLKAHGVALDGLVGRYSRLPFLFVFGRNDATVPFYGCKIFPSDIERIVSEDPVLNANLNSFQLKTVEDEQLKARLEIHLEYTQSAPHTLPDEATLQTMVFDALVRVNQDFREVTRMFDRSQVVIVLHDFETGPFANRDIRIKNKYIG